MNKAVFLDRDGVINQSASTEDDYVTRFEDMTILPGVLEAIVQLNHLGFKVIVVTNQRCVSKGLITTAELDLIHQRMCDYLASAGATIDAVYYCPHALEPPCGCRKPEPGMLLEAARVHDIDLAVSWMIGDSDKDIEAGKRVGCWTARVLSDKQSSCNAADVTAPSLLAAIAKILEFHADPQVASAFEVMFSSGNPRN